MTNIKRAIKESKSLTTKQNDLKTMIQSGEFKIQIKNALPKGGLTTDRYISACLTSLAVTPKLQQCTPSSVLKAFMESARFGLEPNSPLAEAHLIPYGDKVEFQIAYRGMMKLAWNTGMIKSLDFDKVCENDHFVYTKGREITFEHTPNLLSDRGQPYAYYAVAELKNGGFALHIMSKTDIISHGQHYSRSYSSKSSPWQTDFDAMAYKTVIKQLCDKKLPKATTEQSMLLHEAARLDDIPDDLEAFPDIEVASVQIANSEQVEEKQEIQNNNQPEDDSQDVQQELIELTEDDIISEERYRRGAGDIEC
jgi:recombination protein RecT|tara:strand:+ start:2333 stop:3259 length:927 start_codon:yes stop_codon:yes gene_type:complete